MDGAVKHRRDAACAEPSRDLADEEARALFWEQAAAVLSDEQLCATWLFYVEQMPAPQIAEVLGRTWVSIKTILFRAGRKLMPIFAESEIGTPRAAGSAAMDRATALMSRISGLRIEGS